MANSLCKQNPTLVGFTPCKGEDACYGNIMDFLVHNGGDDREEFIVLRHMEPQCLTNESSMINGPSLGGYRGRYVREHVVKPMCLLLDQVFPHKPIF